MPKIQDTTTAIKSGRKRNSRSKKGKPTADREVLYPKVTVELCIGDNAITADRAKELLGWRELADDSEEEHQLVDLAGKRIVCDNNDSNRPVYKTSLATLQQEILRGRWRFNGEGVIIGRTGILLNGQHTLISLVLAEQAFSQDPEAYDYWENMPTCDKLVVFGVEETDDVVNTMDTCKPRSLTDVIYRSDYFSAFKQTDRKHASRMTSYAISMIWDRTGVKTEEGAPRRTHAESIAFLDAHPGLLECIRHIIDLDVDGKVKQYLSPGYAAGLMYLMATCKTDPAEYVQVRNESAADLSMLETAKDFWTGLSSRSDKSFNAFRSVYAEMAAEGNTSIPERVGVIVKAWTRYMEGKTIRANDLELLYSLDSEGERQLSETPEVGGIDVLHIENVIVPGEEAGPSENDPSPEEIAQRAAQERKESLKRKAAENRKSKQQVTAVEVGDKVWVRDVDSLWEGELVEKLKARHGWVAHVKAAKGYEGAGQVWEVNLDRVTKHKPHDDAVAA